MGLAEKALRALNEMSRGILITDENQLDLVPYLQDKNIRVIVPETEESDLSIKRRLLPKRILVTNNTRHFIADAPAYEYGIIAIEGLKSKDPATIADIISKAATKFDLWSKRRGFVLKLRDDGKHEFKDLVK